MNITLVSRGIAVLAILLGAFSLPHATDATEAPGCTASLRAADNEHVVTSGDEIVIEGEGPPAADRVTARIHRHGGGQAAWNVPGGNLRLANGRVTGTDRPHYGPGTTQAVLELQFFAGPSRLESCLSDPLEVDLVQPTIESVALVEGDLVDVRFSEPVLDPAQPESVWRVEDRPPLDVEGENRTAVRRLRLAVPEDEDANPRVVYEFTGSLSGRYTDIAGNAVAENVNFRLAVDRVVPRIPTITGVAGDDTRTDERASATEPSPTVTVGDVTAGHTVRLYRDGAVVATTNATQSGPTRQDGMATFTLPLAADGTIRVTAEAVDPAGNVGGLSDPVLYVLDRVPPELITAAVAGAPADNIIEVAFSEAVSGPDSPADWDLSGLSDVIVVERTDSADRRRLRTSLPITAGTTLAYRPTAAGRYSDEAGNQVNETVLTIQAALPPVLRVIAPDSALTEGNTGTTRNATFTLKVSREALVPVIAEWETVDGTASAGSDYTHTSGRTMFLPTETTKTLTVPVHGDALQEADERFAVRITAAYGVPADPAAASAPATILDDDRPPLVTIADASLVEPQTSPAIVQLPVTLDRPSAQTVRVAWSLSLSGTATPDKDIDPGGGTLEFGPGITRMEIAIVVRPDDEGEQTEFAYVDLSNPANALLRRSRGTVTIADADGGRRGSVPNVVRIAGNDRVETAVEVSEALWETSEHVVLARHDAYADALAGGPLAATLDGPVLLTSSSGLDSATAAEIRRLGATSARLLGGTAALSSEVEDDLRARTGVRRIERIAGSDRFATAAAIAREIGGVDVYVVQGAASVPSRGWPDAVAVSALAAHQRRPILLTFQDRLPRATSEVIDDLDASTAGIIGGEMAVSEDVAEEIRDLGVAVDRTAGTTRYDTSARVATLSVMAGLKVADTWLVTGRDWPDALVAGPGAARATSVVLLTQPDRLSSPASSWLRRHAGAIEQIRLVGGDRAIAPKVGEDAREAATESRS